MPALCQRIIPPATPTFDAVASATGPGTSNQVACSLAAAAGAGILVAVSVYATTTAGVKFGTTPMGRLIGAYWDNLSYDGETAIFGLVGCGTGSPVTITATLGANEYACIGAVSYRQLAGFGATASAYGYTDKPALNVSSAPGHRAFAAFGDYYATMSAFTQTQRFAPYASAGVGLIGGDAPGAASVSFGETLSRTEYWSGVGVDLYS